MGNDESRPKAEQGSTPAAPYTGTGSLDFTDRSPATPSPGADARPARRPRKTTGSSDPDKARSSRRLAVPFLIVIAIALVVAFALTRRPAKEPVTPSPSATPASPTQRSPSTQKTPQADTPPLAAAPQSTPTRTLPAEFLKAFQEYAAKSASKAIALALDNDGRSAHVSVFGYSTQSEANEAALSECTRFKVQSGVQENCRLYAAGDEVVW